MNVYRMTRSEIDAPPDTTTLKLSADAPRQTYTKDVLGAVITATKALTSAPGPLVLNTPHLPADPYSESGGGVPLLAPETVRRIETLMEQARRYIAGERAQGSLFTENASPSSPA